MRERKTLIIHLEHAPELPNDNWCAWIEEGEYAKMLVAADTPGEAVSELGISITVMDKYKKSINPTPSA